MITRMTSDINQAQSGVNMVLRLFLRSPFIVFGAMIMAFTIDVKAALIFVVTIPVLSVVVFGIMIITIPLFRRVQASLDKVLGVTRENLTGSRVIRAFNKEQEEIADFDESNERLTDAVTALRRKNFSIDESAYLYYHQRGTGYSYLDRCNSGKYRKDFTGRSSSTGKLYVPDSGGISKACET